MAKKYLLDVSEKDWNEADEFFKNEEKKVQEAKNKNQTYVPQIKLHKASSKKENKGKTKLSFIRIEGVTYAMANGEYLGEGRYGKVKIVQNSTGDNFAVKIEGRGKKAQDAAEVKITKAIGYMKGEEERTFTKEEKKIFKEEEVTKKSYMVMEYFEGKELFQHLYKSDILIKTPGYLYEKDELKRRNDKSALTDAQKYIAALKCCEAIEDLHHRGIIHGDIKPANFMMDASGNRIVVGAIDFGLSLLNEPGKGAERPGIPLGTPERYMPKEVLAGKAQGQNAQFSFASDVYSLGKMFEEDFELPQDVYGAMIAESKDQRAHLADVKKKLIEKLKESIKDIPEAEQDEEIKKIIAESENGIRPLKERKKRIDSQIPEDKLGPQQRGSFVAQVMSGYRDPRASLGDTTPVHYTMEDFKILATSIFSLTPPSDRETKKSIDGVESVELKKGFFTQLKEGYDALGNDSEDKVCYLHNANIFIRELIKADVNQVFTNDLKKEFDEFIELAQKEENKEIKAEFEQLKKDINHELSLAKELYQKRKEYAEPAKSTENTEKIDIQTYLKETLKQAPKQAVASKLQLTGLIHQSEIKAVAQDLMQMQLTLLAKVNPTDFYDNKTAKDTEGKLSFSQLVSHFNNLSQMVASDILLTDNKAHQKRVYAFYVQLARQSIKEGDFSTAMAIYSGLNKGPVTRLKHLESQPPAIKKMMRKNEAFLSQEKNYEKIRLATEKKIAAKEIYVPYVISLSQQVNFNADGNPKESSKTQRENENFMQIEGKIISSVIDVQKLILAQPPRPYATTIIKKFSQPKLETDKELYERSEQIKPKGQAAKLRKFSEIESSDEFLKRTRTAQTQGADKQKTKSSESSLPVKNTTATSLTEYLKEPHIPESVQQLTKKGAIKAKPSTTEGALAGGRKGNWLEQTFSEKETVLLEQLKTVEPPKTYSTKEIEEAYSELPIVSSESDKDTTQRPTITVVKEVSASDLHRYSLGGNSIFQIASQFDFQESMGAFDTPVSNYHIDTTQGPLASIEASAAALHRKAAKQEGKLPHMLLELIPAELIDNYKNPPLYKDGYLDIKVITEKEDKEKLRKSILDNIEKIKILPQWVQCEASGALQMQVFCAAPSFQLKDPDDKSAIPEVGSIEHEISEALVVAQYRAIAQLAVLRSRETGETVPLHLSMVGQGTFRNNPTVMKKAMEAVAQVVKGEKVSVYVHAFKKEAQDLILEQMAEGKGKDFDIVEMSKDQFKTAHHPSKSHGAAVDASKKEEKVVELSANQSFIIEVGKLKTAIDANKPAGEIKKMVLAIEKEYLDSNAKKAIVADKRNKNLPNRLQRILVAEQHIRASDNTLSVPRDYPIFTFDELKSKNPKFTNEFNNLQQTRDRLQGQLSLLLVEIERAKPKVDVEKETEKALLEKEILYIRQLETEIHKEMIEDFKATYQELKSSLSSLKEGTSERKAIEEKINTLENQLRACTLDADTKTRNGAVELMRAFGILGKPEDTFIKQLLSGYKDPTKFTSTDIQVFNEKFTQQDYIAYAKNLVEFVKPTELLRDLAEIYSEQKVPEVKAEILENASLLLRELIANDRHQEFFPDFNVNDGAHSDVRNAYQQFMDLVKNDADSNEKIKKAVQVLDNTVKAATKLATKTKEANAEKIKSLRVPADNEIDVDKFLTETLATNVSEEEMDRMATIFAQDYRSRGLAFLQDIRSSEFHGQAWTKERNKPSSRVVKWAQDFNVSSNLVAHDLLSAKTPAHQKNIAMLYAKILKKALDSGDYNTAQAIVSGLTKPAVYRLKYLRDMPEYQSILQRAEEVFSAQGNFKNYKLAVESSKKQRQIIIPFLGSKLTEITFTHENKDFHVDPNNPERGKGKVLNAKKVAMLGNIIGEFQHFQDVAASEAVVPIQSNIDKRLQEYSNAYSKERQERENQAFQDLVDSDTAKMTSKFYARSPIKLDEIKNLNDLKKNFPNGVNSYLRVEINGTEYEGKSAFKKLLKISSEYVKKLSLEDKRQDSSMKNIINSMHQWAVNNGVFADDIQKQILAMEQATVMSQDELYNLRITNWLEDDVVREFNDASSEEDKDKIKQKVIQLKGGKDHENKVVDPLVVKSAENALIKITSLEKIASLNKDQTKLNKKLSERSEKELNETDLVEIFAWLVEVKEIEKGIYGYQKDTHPVVKQEAMKIQLEQPLIERIKNGAALKLSSTPKEYLEWLQQRAKPQHQDLLKETNSHLKNIRDGILILATDPDESVKKNAKEALTAVDKLARLDKLRKDYVLASTEEQKNKITIEIGGLRKDANPFVRNYVAEIVTPEMLEVIKQNETRFDKLCHSFGFIKEVKEDIRVMDEMEKYVTKDGKSEWKEGYKPVYETLNEEKNRAGVLVLEEILQTEIDYIRDLEILLSKKEKILAGFDSAEGPPPRKALTEKDLTDIGNTKGIKEYASKEKIQLIFEKISQLKTAHEKLLKSLQTPNTNEWINDLKAMEKLHTDYSILVNELGYHPQVNGMILGDPDMRGLSIIDFTAKPFQRMTKYSLLMRELTKSIDKDKNPVTHANVSTLFDVVMDMVERINYAKKVNEVAIGFLKAVDSYQDNQNLKKLIVSLNELGGLKDLKAVDIGVLFMQTDFSSASSKEKEEFEEYINELFKQKITFTKDPVEKEELGKLKNNLLHRVADDKAIHAIRKLATKAKGQEKSLLAVLLQEVNAQKANGKPVDINQALSDAMIKNREAAPEKSKNAVAEGWINLSAKYADDFNKIKTRQRRFTETMSEQESKKVVTPSAIKSASAEQKPETSGPSKVAPVKAKPKNVVDTLQNMQLMLLQSYDKNSDYYKWVPHSTVGDAVQNLSKRIQETLNKLPNYRTGNYNLSAWDAYAFAIRNLKNNPDYMRRFLAEKQNAPLRELFERNLDLLEQIHDEYKVFHGRAASNEPGKHARIGEYVATNSPLWHIPNGDLMSSGQPSQSLAVQKVLAGELIVEDFSSTMLRGKTYSYPDTLKVQGLTPVTSVTSPDQKPLLYGTMAPDQFYSPVEIGFSESIIRSLISEFADQYQGNDKEEKKKAVEAKLKELKFHTFDQAGYAVTDIFITAGGVAQPNTKKIDEIVLPYKVQIGQSHVDLVANTIGQKANDKQPPQYAVITIAGKNQSETIGYGLNHQYEKSLKEYSHHLVSGASADEFMPTVAVYQGHNPNISQQMVIQSDREINGHPAKIAMYGNDMNQLIKFYDATIAKGIPVAVNCTDGIDRTGIIIVAMSMFHQFKNGNDISGKTTDEQQKFLMDLLNNLRSDRGPNFLRQEHDIPRGVVLGYALIATQKQLNFQNDLLKNDKGIQLDERLIKLCKEADATDPQLLEEKLRLLIPSLDEKNMKEAKAWQNLIVDRIKIDFDFQYVCREDTKFSQALRNQLFEAKDPHSHKLIKISEAPISKLNELLEKKQFDIISYKDKNGKGIFHFATDAFLKNPTMENLNELAKLALHGGIGAHRAIEEQLKANGLDERLLGAAMQIADERENSTFYSKAKEKFRIRQPAHSVKSLFKERAIKQDGKIHFEKMGVKEREQISVSLDKLIQNADEESKVIFKEIKKSLPSIKTSRKNDEQRIRTEQPVQEQASEEKKKVGFKKTITKGARKARSFGGTVLTGIRSRVKGLRKPPEEAILFENAPPMPTLDPAQPRVDENYLNKDATMNITDNINEFISPPDVVLRSENETRENKLNGALRYYTYLQDLKKRYSDNGEFSEHPKAKELYEKIIKIEHDIKEKIAALPETVLLPNKDNKNTRELFEEGIRKIDAKYPNSKRKDVSTPESAVQNEVTIPSAKSPKDTSLPEQNDPLGGVAILEVPLEPNQDEIDRDILMDIDGLSQKLEDLPANINSSDLGKVVQGVKERMEAYYLKLQQIKQRYSDGGQLSQHKQASGLYEESLKVEEQIKSRVKAVKNETIRGVLEASISQMDKLYPDSKRKDVIASETIDITSSLVEKQESDTSSLGVAILEVPPELEIAQDKITQDQIDKNILVGLQTTIKHYITPPNWGANLPEKFVKQQKLETAGREYKALQEIKKRYSDVGQSAKHPGAKALYEEALKIEQEIKKHIETFPLEEVKSLKESISKIDAEYANSKRQDVPVVVSEAIKVDTSKPPLSQQTPPTQSDQRKSLLTLGPKSVNPPPMVVVHQAKGNLKGLNEYLLKEGVSKHQLKKIPPQKVNIKANGYMEVEALELNFVGKETEKSKDKDKDKDKGFKAYAHEDHQGIVFSMQQGLEDDPEKFKEAVMKICYLAVMNADKGTEFDLSVVKDEKIRPIVEEAFKKAIEKAVSEKRFSDDKADQPKVKSMKT